MKKLTLVVGGLSALVLVALAPASSQAQIAGSKHDYTTDTNWFVNGKAAFGSSRTNICGPCHTIHHANPTGGGPIWAHADSQLTYIVYSSPTFQGGTPSITGSSKACLSCHDGSVAINEAYSASGVTTNGGTAVFVPSGVIIPDGSPANDLSHMHPIGFSYDTAAAADPDIHPTTTSVPGTSGTIATVMLKGPTHTMECASCHDIHRTKGNAVGNTGIMTIVGGQALCMTCHNK